HPAYQAQPEHDDQDARILHRRNIDNGLAVHASRCPVPESQLLPDVSIRQMNASRQQESNGVDDAARDAASGDAVRQWELLAPGHRVVESCPDRRPAATAMAA